ncbi:1 2C2-dihydroxy-3-keto-5-methylthiopentene dioxygenase [Aphis craccivora]|uniref:1 2C2-dihydroxy-3-keto-5-methylthiopentene dioxygenase n=1 Tax=Aphis craccivora TaxID=307492 RepID=A0A6G0YJS1_APHCR|nr:1 2C2-dihydroxy-3-keto-5-methylthiopentene dioxygenase [Aphis craccivora]
MKDGHKKGALDGVGGCRIKKTANQIVAHGEDINCFKSFVKILKENVRKVEITLVHEQNIQSMKNNIPPEILSFKVHQVVFMKEFPNKLVMRKQSCFDCYDCDMFSLGHHNIILSTNEEADCLKKFPVEVKCDVRYIRHTTNIVNFRV